MQFGGSLISSRPLYEEGDYKLWESVLPDDIPKTLDFGPVVGQRLIDAICEHQISDSVAQEIIGLPVDEIVKLGKRDEGQRVSGKMVLALSEHLACDPYLFIAGESRPNDSSSDMVVDYVSINYANRHVEPASDFAFYKEEVRKNISDSKPEYLERECEDEVDVAVDGLVAEHVCEWDIERSQVRIGETVVKLDAAAAKSLYRTIDRLRRLSGWEWSDVCSDLRIDQSVIGQMRKGSYHFVPSVIDDLLKNINESAAVSMSQLFGLDDIPDGIYD